MHYTRDFQYTRRDQDAGFPTLTAQLAATDTAILINTYAANMRDCFHMIFGRNMRVLQRELGKHLLDRGITMIPNLFGSIAITDQW